MFKYDCFVNNAFSTGGIMVIGMKETGPWMSISKNTKRSNKKGDKMARHSHKEQDNCYSSSD